MRLRTIVASAIAALSLGQSASAVGFDISLRLRGPFSDSQRLRFFDAERYWESVILGYQPGISIPRLNIVARTRRVDGESGVLGFAALRRVTSQGGFVVARAGSLTLDRADLAAEEAGGRLGPLIAHEIGHLLGFGLLWTANDVYTNGTGRYRGAAGVAAYRAEFDPAADFVPVELGGGPGTRDVHWAESWAGGNRELMTGFLDAPTFVSGATIASLQDIGYVTATGATPVPLPPTAPLVAAAIAALIGAARFRRRG